MLDLRPQTQQKLKNALHVEFNSMLDQLLAESWRPSRECIAHGCSVCSFSLENTPSTVYATEVHKSKHIEVISSTGIIFSKMTGTSVKILLWTKWENVQMLAFKMRQGKFALSKSDRFLW